MVLSDCHRPAAMRGFGSLAVPDPNRLAAVPRWKRGRGMPYGETLALRATQHRHRITDGDGANPTSAR